MTPLLALLLVQAERSPDVTLPFTSRGGLVVVETPGNDGKPLRALVDTGARRTVVDAEAAKRLGLENGEPVKARGSGGVVETHFVKGLSLKGLGEASVEAVALPLEELSAAIGTPLDMILGEDVLAKRVVEIDWAAGKLTLGSRPPVVSASATVLSLRLDGGRPYAPAVVVAPDGREEVAELLLDTGSDTIVELSQSYANWIRVRTAPDPAGRSLLGVGGTVPLRIAEVREARLGRESIPPASVRVFPQAFDRAGDGDGRLGSGFLSRYKTTIDGPGLKLVLTPVRKP